MVKLEALHNTEKKYYEEGVRIIETLKNAYSLYIRQTPSEKKKNAKLFSIKLHLRRRKGKL